MQPSSGFPPLGPPCSGPRGLVGGGSPDGRWKRMAGELERSLGFLQRQHGETLSKLHEEVELLKRENKELHYRLIMHPILQKAADLPPSGKPRPRGSSVSKSPHGSKIAAEDLREDDFSLSEKPHPRSGSESRTPRSSRAAAEEDPREDGLSVPEELEEKAVASKTNAEAANLEGERVGVTPKEVVAPIPEPKVAPAKESPYRKMEFCDQTTSPNPPPSPAQSRAVGVRIPAASSNPFLANVLPSCVRKPPTLEECEAVIRQLWNINHMQMQELTYLRSCLEDIHRTRRIPDYMLVGHLGNPQTTRFPKMKNAPKQCGMLTPLPAAERAVLPALKQTLGNAFAERQKRVQAAQRKRLHRTAL